LPGRCDRAISSQQNLDCLGAFDNAESYGCSHAERAFGTYKYPGEIITRRVGRGRTKVHQFTAGENDVQRKHVSRSEAILQAMGPAGIFGHVSADGAYSLGRRIWSVEVTC
jgi:hypothetical protein